MTASSVPGFSRRQLFIVISSLMLATLLASMEVSIIATALPTIVGEFDAFESFAWVGTAYIVSSAISTPLLGKLSDLYGRRRLFQVAMGIFVVGSLLCGSSRSIGQLIAARAVQGVGGGGIQAMSFAILGDILPPRERGRYIGYFTLAFTGAALLGPLLGGFIIDHFSWPWIFLVNVPLGLVVAALCHRSLRLPFRRREADIDFAGAALLVAAIGASMIGLEQGRDGWLRPQVLVLLGIGALATVGFVAVERRAREPMIPLRLFANPVVRVSCLLGMFAGVVTYGAAQFLPLYFQDSQFLSPTMSGLRMLPQMVGVTAATFGVGRLIAHSGDYKRYPIVGAALAVAGAVGIAQIDGATKYIWLALPMVGVGFGCAAIFTTTSIASQNAVPFDDLGVTTATLMFFRSLGGSMGLAVFGTLLNSVVRSELPRRAGVTVAQATGLIRSPKDIKALPDDTRRAVIDTLAQGVGNIYWVCALALGAAVVLGLFLPQRPLRTRSGMEEALAEGATFGD